MSTWTIYFILMLDSFLVCSVLSAALLFVTVGFSLLAANDEYGEDKDKIIKRITKPALAIAVLFACIAMFTPSTKQALIIMGTTYATNNERISVNVDKTLEYIERVLDEKLSDTKEATE